MNPEQQSPALGRLYSIDVFRAVTMLLMIWVNDFWSLTDIPQWLQHATIDEDTLGFSDVIFPAFLFIVGLSIPFAIEKRRQRSDTINTILLHVLSRTFALLVMGVYMVNLESLSDDQMLINKFWWQILMVAAFVLIWNDYPVLRMSNRTVFGLKFLGCVLLVFLAISYRGSGTDWMQRHWWGILGLIGWGYLICSVIFIFGKLHWSVMALCWAFFAGFNVVEAYGLLEPLSGVRSFIWIVGDGAIPALTMAGVFVSTLYLQKFSGRNTSQFLWILVGLGLFILAFGILLRPLGGISKIRSTPSWTEICTAISILSFAFLFWLVDQRGKKDWFGTIRPAGSATLTCYLLPYFIYPIITIVGLHLPITLSTGLVGLAGAMIFALVVVWLTGLLNRFQVMLRL